jgi:hypothetical protein
MNTVRLNELEKLKLCKKNIFERCEFGFLEKSFIEFMPN